MFANIFLCYIMIISYCVCVKILTKKPRTPLSLNSIIYNNVIAVLIREWRVYSLILELTSKIKMPRYIQELKFQTHIIYKS